MIAFDIFHLLHDSFRCILSGKGFPSYCQCPSPQKHGSIYSLFGYIMATVLGVLPSFACSSMMDLASTLFTFLDTLYAMMSNASFSVPPLYSTKEPITPPAFAIKSGTMRTPFS